MKWNKLNSKNYQDNVQQIVDDLVDESETLLVAYRSGDDIYYDVAQLQTSPFEESGYSKKNCRLEVHHVKFKSNGGTDDEENLLTLCEDCHKGVHAGTVVLNKKPKKSKNLKYATHMSIIRSYLLKKYPNAIETFGFVTSENRNHLQLKKDHYIDACVVASGGLEFKELDVIYYKHRVSKGDYKLARGIRGEQKLPTGKICSFRKFDKVEYLRKEYFIKSRMSKGFATLMDIFGNKIDFSYMPKCTKTPKLSNCKRISARSSCLCIISQIRKERAIPVLS